MLASELMTRDTIIERYRERIALGRRTKLFSGEFEALVADFIRRLAQAHSRDDIQQLCTAEIALLEEGYKQVTLASDYIPKYRKAIEQAIADGLIIPTQATAHDYTHQQRMTGIQEYRSEHWALIFFKYDREVYEELDFRQAKLNRRKLLNLKTVNPRRYLGVLDQLLHSQDKFRDRHMAVAIAGLTGRRLGEVLARGSFQLTDHPHLLHFEGQQKYERSGYDIITLIPAQELLPQIEAFRDLPEIKGLMRLQGEALTQAINKFDVQVNRECHKYLSPDQLVPLLQNRKRVTVHNLRSLWGAIAVWMFCPPHQHEYAFIQHYLGHVLESSATGHYFRYRLVDETGRLLKEQGTMLTQVPELPLLDEEQVEIREEPMVEVMKNTPPKQQTRKQTKKTSDRAQGNLFQSTEVQPQALREQVMEQMEQIKDQLRAEWQRQLATLRQELLTQMVQSRQPQESEGVLWLAERVASLELENEALMNGNKALVKERDALKLELEQLQQRGKRVQELEVQKRSLATQLKEAQAKLDGFRKLLLGNDDQNDKDQTQPQLSTESVEANTQRRRGKPGRKPGKAIKRAQTVFDALRAWNVQHPEQTLALSPGLLETGFKIHRQAAKQYCADFQTEINDHHAEVGVEKPMSHNRGKDLERFKAFVAEFH